MDIEGAAPQNAAADAAGVSLVHTELQFLELIRDPLADLTPGAIDGAARAIHLNGRETAYLREWIVNGGQGWLNADDDAPDFDDWKVVFLNPTARKLVDYAADHGLCRPCSAAKEEAEVFATAWMRDESLPMADRRGALDILAKLKGFYPDAKAKGQGGTNVIINVNDPYKASGNGREVVINAGQED